MVLLDSDVVLILRDPRWGEKLAKRLDNIRLATCNMIMVEVLGMQGLDKTDAFYFVELFETMNNLPFDEEVARCAVEIRRNYGVPLPNAIVAATAMVNDVALWTHDTQSFKGIRRLQLIDPLAR